MAVWQVVWLYHEMENMVPALTTNTKSRFDIDLKAVYEPSHISIATMKPRHGSALLPGRGKRTDGCCLSLASKCRRCSHVTWAHRQWHLDTPPLPGPDLQPHLSQPWGSGAGEGHQPRRASFLVLALHAQLSARATVRLLVMAQWLSQAFLVALL